VNGSAAAAPGFHRTTRETDARHQRITASEGDPVRDGDPGASRADWAKALVTHPQTPAGGMPMGRRDRLRVVGIDGLI
jgi:hypothetical protein